MVSCGELPRVVPGPADALLDRAWLALQHEDAEALARVEQEFAALPGAESLLQRRMAWDRRGLAEGRAATLVACGEADDPWAARYLASGAAARDELGELDTGRPSVWTLELAHRSADSSRRRRLARECLAAGVAPAEALALLAEGLLAAGELRRLESLLDDAPRTARLDWVRRQLLLASGRPLGGAAALVDDLERRRITPTGVVRLEQVLAQLPDQTLEQRARRALDDWRAPAGSRLERALADLGAWLAARRGDLERATAGPEPVAVLARRRHQRWADRLRLEADGDAAVRPIPEHRLDRGPARRSGTDRDWLVTTRAWSLAARQAYGDVLRGADVELDDFLARLDSAASHLPGTPALTDLPRRDFGLFGTLLDPLPLATPWPRAFLLGGQGLLQPPELTLYDLVQVAPRGVGAFDYTEHRVARRRVPGFVASQGAVFTGAGILDSVFLDDELLDAELARLEALPERPSLPPRPAADTRARRSLAEPLDVADQLAVAARREAGAQLAARVHEVLSLHEGQHILDARDFLERGTFGRLGMLFQGGLLPGNVRAELERRAQLRALRESAEPRLALAECVARVPLEGRLAHSEHARGYASLLAAFIEVLDRGAWAADADLAALGLSRDHNLLQQLPRLDVATIRAVARAVPD